jgi:phosphatidylserine decarboxylase
MFNFFNESKLISLFIFLIIYIGYLRGNNKLIYFMLVVLLFFIYFYREPSINTHGENIDDNMVLSPAYGVVKKIIYNNNNIHIIIFLSINDIHIQYYPIRGKIKSIEYDPSGKYELAYELNKSSMNEKNITTIIPKANIGGNVIIKQIAGYLVRRISNVKKIIGSGVEPVEKMGMIKFGSRVDLIIPQQYFDLKITEGQYVYGPDTIIGKYSL